MMPTNINDVNRQHVIPRISIPADNGGEDRREFIEAKERRPM
jgi:hypothetical protein